MINVVDMIRKFLSIRYGQVIIDNTENPGELMSIEYMKWDKNKYRLELKFTQDGILILSNIEVE